MIRADITVSNQNNRNPKGLYRFFGPNVQFVTIQTWRYESGWRLQRTKPCSDFQTAGNLSFNVFTEQSVWL